MQAFFIAAVVFVDVVRHKCCRYKLSFAYREISDQSALAECPYRSTSMGFLYELHMYCLHRKGDIDIR
jgi:hypothetical protein